MFHEGVKTLFRFALAIFILLENDILKQHEFSSVYKVLTEGPKRISKVSIWGYFNLIWGYFNFILYLGLFY